LKITRGGVKLGKAQSFKELGGMGRGSSRLAYEERKRKSGVLATREKMRIDGTRAKGKGRGR